MDCLHCKQPAYGRGLCRYHYYKERRAGTLQRFDKLPKDDRARFKERYTVDHVTGCWNWNARTDKHGYGEFSYEGRDRRAHRISYLFHHGELPNKHLCHKCDNPPCVNPDHLYVGTQVENMRDAAERHRMPTNELHWNNKLTDDQVREIRASSEVHRILAEHYGVAGSTISSIKTGRNRSTVT